MGKARGLVPLESRIKSTLSRCDGLIDLGIGGAIQVRSSGWACNQNCWPEARQMGVRSGRRLGRFPIGAEAIGWLRVRLMGKREAWAGKRSSRKK